MFDKVIAKWRRGYQLSLIGYPFNNNLDAIQELFESVIETILECKNQITVVLEQNRSIRMAVDNETGQLEQVNGQLTNLMSSLVKLSLVIEEQPIMFKKDAAFKLAGRFLFGKKLNDYALLADIRVKLVTVKQALQITKNNLLPKMNSTSSTEPIVLNSTASLNFSSTTSKFNLANMQLHRFNRKPEDSQHVVEKKYHLLVLGT